MVKLIFVGTGGFFGAVLRYLVSIFITELFPRPLVPLGTLTVNIIGSFIMGLANGYMIYHSMIPENLRYLLLAGFLGAFTTYSTFSIEAVFLLKDNNFIVMSLYIFLHLLLGIGSAAAGFYLMRVL
ncbi:MAG: fluoride efflux transporter CrcB [Desulfobacteraceae bacterium]|nr:fluoride efflux transporter CrcB [Desulfobacteraceae bacterium]